MPEKVPAKVRVTITVNGTAHDVLVEPRTLLVDFLREQLELPGTHIGCEQGVCGACTVRLDGRPTRSCLLFAAQLDGCDVTTVESLGRADGTLHPVQRAFAEHHGLQCGFCTPGMLMAACALLERVPVPDADDVRESLGGNLCRCTGYQNIVRAVCAAGAAIASSADADGHVTSGAQA